MSFNILFLFSWTQPKETQNETSEVSKTSNLSTISLPLHSLRKRVTSCTPKQTHGDLIELQKLTNSLDIDKPSVINFGKNYKVHPHEQSNHEEFGFFSKQDSLERKSSSRECSDLELETYIGKRRQKNVSYKNEEKSQLICYKDKRKIITTKNDSKLTKYNTFDMKCIDKSRLVKYKSLDIPSNAKTIVKFIEPNSKLSISAEDFYTDCKGWKFERKKHRQDIIMDTVDAWAKKSGKNVLLNLKNSLFCNSTEKEDEVIYKPLIFGGTYPIDCPTRSNNTNKNVENAIYDNEIRNNHTIKPSNMTHPSNSKLREYGPPRTFNIDQPI